jgi:hypothetical protein
VLIDTLSKVNPNPQSSAEDPPLNFKPRTIDVELSVYKLTTEESVYMDTRPIDPSNTYSVLERSHVKISDLVYYRTNFVALNYSDPIELYQHLPLPFSLGKLTVTLKSEKEFIAVDALGTYSMELSNADLSNCHVLTEHTGNLFVCPHMNLLRRHPKSTCLGALLVGSDQALNLCTQAVEKAGSTVARSCCELMKVLGGWKHFH